MSELLEKIRMNCIEDGDCWLWNGALAGGKTPVMRVGRKVINVRRVVAKEKGLNVDGRLATNKCEHGLCVCQAHSIVVTRRALQKRSGKNFRGTPVDMLRRKKISDRARTRAKLTPEKAKEIRLASGTQREIAERFGVTQYTVGAIKSNKIWKDYSNPWLPLMAV